MSLNSTRGQNFLGRCGKYRSNINIELVEEKLRRRERNEEAMRDTRYE